MLTEPLEKNIDPAYYILGTFEATVTTFVNFVARYCHLSSSSAILAIFDNSAIYCSIDLQV